MSETLGADGGLHSEALMYGFDWSARKAASNERKHGIAFERAAEAFDDPFSLTIPDPDHSRDEERHVLIGCTRDGEILVVVHALRGDTIRLISARRATATERTAYEEA